MKKLLYPILWSVSAAVFAHPHVWMDIEVTPQLNKQGEIVALHERWLFDPLYAQMLLESVLREPDAAVQQQLWAHLQDDIRTKLGEEHYYTFPHEQFSAPQDGTLVNEQGNLYVDVTVPLNKPMHELRYQIYEPEYFVEILHSEAQPKQFSNGCTLNIIAAEPSAEKFAEAAALDRDEQGEENLGSYFAETGVITCP